MTNSTQFSTQKEQWHNATLEPLVKRFGERQERFTTSSDAITVEPLYVPVAGETTAARYLEQEGFPGEYPFTRGVQPNMYRGRLWTMRQYAGFSTAAESNQRYHYLLERGQTGISVAFDLPTQIGYDADHALAEGEVGKVGVSISSLRDMETLLKDIPLDKVSISMTINAPAAILLAMVIAVGKQQGIGAHQLRGTIQNDILKEYIARGTYIFPPAPSMRLITDIFRYCAADVPKWNTISISGYHMREAGCTAVQEVAFTLANGIEYVQQALDAGLNIDSFAGQLSFFFNAHNNFLEEIAKFRAARRLWARIMRDRFGAQRPDSCKLRFHTQTGGSTLTAQQPENNIVRVALQALAAVMGGTQSLHTNGMDEALALPTEKSVEIALRTQQIIAYESGVADTVDPLGGSYYIEQLTDEIERQATDYIARIDTLGGALRSVEEGFVQREIQDAAYKTQRAIERDEQVVVGVNRYQTAGMIQPELLRVDEQVRLDQMNALQQLRIARDAHQVTTILQQIEQAARTPGAPLMPLFVTAVEADITLGEICDTLRGVFWRIPTRKLGLVMQRQAYFQIIHKYINPDSPVYPIYIVHCGLVTNKALSIAKRLHLSPESQTFIEEAAMLHDIGIVRTNTPDIYCYGDLPYLCHLTEGRKILEAEGLPRHAIVAETHVGVGLSKEQIRAQNLPLPYRDMKPTTIEEEIIGFSDLFFSKNPAKLWRERSMKKVRENVSKRGLEQVAILEDWLKRFT